MIISNKLLSFSEIIKLFLHNGKYQILKSTIKEIELCYNFLIKNKTKSDIYGLNTGFGPMASYKVDLSNYKSLQENLIYSHAVGQGAKMPKEFSKFVLLTRLFTLIKAKSAASPQLIDRILFFLNNKIYPVFYEHGSVGASGDLIQLADIMKGLLGKGLVYYEDKIVNAEILSLPEFEIGLRDGLAFINGTSAMTAIGLYNIYLSRKILNISIFTSSLLIELLNSYDDLFSKELNFCKLHTGQRIISKIIKENLQGSVLISKRFKKNANRPNIQEPYSVRCAPQILGPIYDAIENASDILVKEFNSISDNPIFDYKNNKILFGGNFHGDYVSFEMDKIKIAIAKLSKLLNRQLVVLLNPAINKKFPPFQNYKTLGLNLALQGIEFISASTVSENLTLSYPHYLHDVVSNNDNQDIVSMGANSALVCNKVLMNALDILAPLLFALMTAVYFNKLYEKLTNHHKIILKEFGYFDLTFDDERKFQDNLLNLKNKILAQNYI